MLASDAEVADFLKGLLSEPDLLLFAGAGVGKRVGLPDWAEYTAKIADFVESYEPPAAALMRNRAAAKRFSEAFQFLDLCSPMPPADKYAAIAKPFCDPKPDPTPLLPLVRLPFAAIVTTNFDASLIDAYVKARGLVPRTAGPADVPLKECPFMHEFFVARIHGKAEYPPSMVLSRDAYEKLKQDHSYIDFLHFLLTHRRCLFLGFSFLDPAIQNVLQTIADKSIAAAKVHHALIPSDADTSLAQSLAQLGVRVAQYSCANNHAILWEGVSRAAAATIEPVVEGASKSSTYNWTKHLVAVSYAAAQLGSDEEAALTDLVLQGVILASMDTLEASLSDAAIALRAAVPLEISESIALAERLLADLERRGLIKTVNGAEPLWKAAAEKLDTDNAIRALTTSFGDRLLVRESLELREEDRAGVGEMIREAILERSWELAQDFMAPAPREEKEDRNYLDALRVMAKSKLPRLAGDKQEAIARTLLNLLVEPDPVHGSILSDLVRLSFGVQVVNVRRAYGALRNGSP